MKGSRLRSCATVAGVGLSLVLAACGSGQTQAASEPNGHFPVRITVQSFPPSQRLAERTELVIVVRNAGRRTIPNIAVSICNVSCSANAPAGEGTSAAAFAQNLDQPYLANPSRPVWIVDRPPGPCQYSCRNGGQGAWVTAYSNTWAAGSLRPGHTARFVWGVTAVAAGQHVVAWQVAAGLNGKAKAVLAGGGRPQGTFPVNISRAPQQSYVNNNGQIVSQ